MLSVIQSEIRGHHGQVLSRGEWQNVHREGFGIRNGSRPRVPYDISNCVKLFRYSPTCLCHGQLTGGKQVIWQSLWTISLDPEDVVVCIFNGGTDLIPRKDESLSLSTGSIQ